MRKFIITLASCLIIAGCLYRPDIQQGNIITDQQVKQIHTGMSRQQVEDVMGTPVMRQPLVTNRINFVYTFKAGHKKSAHKHLILTFYQNNLIRITKQEIVK